MPTMESTVPSLLCAALPKGLSIHGGMTFVNCKQYFVYGSSCKVGLIPWPFNAKRDIAKGARKTTVLLAT